MIVTWPVANGRVALVTGSSRGLGSDDSRQSHVAHDGLAVAVNGRRGDERVGEVGRRIRDDGGTADAFYADVTDEQQPTSWSPRSPAGWARSMCWYSTPPDHSPKPR